MTALFDVCVALLLWLADFFGITYEAINVIIFCGIWPLFTLFLMAYCYRLHLKCKFHQAEVKQLNQFINKHL